MVLIPDDAVLTEAGLPPGHQGRVLLIACGALAHEVLVLKRINGWDHLDLQCLPAKLHLYPDKITAEVAKAVAEHKATYETIFILYADCGTGGNALYFAWRGTNVTGIDFLDEPNIEAGKQKSGLCQRPS